MDLSKIIASEEEREARGGLCPRDLKASRRRRRSARAFMEARTSPAWMLMDVLPVLPQEQRPIVSRGKTDSGFD